MSQKDNSAGNIELENIENNSEAEKHYGRLQKYSKQLPKALDFVNF